MASESDPVAPDVSPSRRPATDAFSNAEIEALRRERDVLRAVIDSVPDHIYTKDITGRYVLNNAANLRLLGAEHERDVAGKTVFDLFPREIAEHFHADDEELFRTGKPIIEREEPFVDDTGKRRWYHTTKVPLRDAAGKVTGLLGISRDVTHSKRSEEALAESENHLRAILESEPECVKLLNADCTLIEMNPAGLAMIEAGSLAQVAGHDVTQLVVPEHRQAFKELIARIFTGASDAMELEITSLKGNRLWVDMRGTPLRDKAQRIIAALCVTRDITERRHNEHALRDSELRFHSVWEKSVDGMRLLDAEGRIIAVNEAFCRLVGVKREELEGQLFTVSYTGTRSPEELLRNYRRRFDKRAIPQRAERRVTFRTGNTADLEIASSFLELPDRPRLLLSLFRDVTARLRLETQLRQSQKMEAIGQLAAGVAHDFNNILTVMIGHTDLVLANVAENDPAHESLTQVKQAGERAAALTRQLLAFSRQQVIEPKVLDLNDVVERLEKMLRRLIGEDIHLRTLLGPRLSPVKIDPSQIDQVIINLAVNARDALPIGGRLMIETRDVMLDEAGARQHPDVAPGHYVMLTVMDNGSGMTPEVRAHIFEPFFTTKGLGHGSGLGLAVVHGIIKQAGGHIALETEVGKGTTIRIYLPALGNARPERNQHGGADAGRGTETILLVEDEEAVRQLTTLSLQRSGYKVLAAASGEEALRLIEEKPVPLQLLLTDVVMPGMSGRELCEELKAVQPALKVLYLSGYTDDAIVRHGILQAEVAFLQKPYSPRTLVNKVREVLDAPAGKDAQAAASPPSG